MTLGVKHHRKPFRTGIQSPFCRDASIVITIIIIISVRLVRNLLISMNRVILVANVCKRFFQKMRIITWVCSNVVQVECLLGGIETFCHALLSDKNKNQHISLQNTTNGHNGKIILL